jgi:sporulation protein YlmC with PRC-barrel domain
MRALEDAMVRSILGFAVVGAIAASGAVAQDTGAPAAEEEDIVRIAQEANELRGSWVIGASVYAPDGAVVGSIDDVLIEETDGSISAAIVSIGGFLGFGSKLIAVDWSQFDISYDGNEITLPITVEEAEAASEFAFRDREFPPPPPAPEPTGGIGTPAPMQ